jgi:hypothetical protein
MVYQSKEHSMDIIPYILAAAWFIAALFALFMDRVTDAIRCNIVAVLWIIVGTLIKG